MIDYSKFEGHTQGPWFVTDLKVYAPDPQMPGIPWVIAEINNDAFYEGANPAKPNAALIAAAPDLLAENKRLRALLDNIQCEIGDYLGEWAAVTKEFAPEEYLPLKNAQEIIDSEIE